MKEKIDKESLGMVTDLIGAAYDMAKGFLEENGYMKFGRMGVAEKVMDKVDPFHYREECKRKGLAFEIIDIKGGNKVRCRKIYFNGHIEGFEDNPLVVNHVFPKIQALKYLAQSINEEYRDLMRRFILSDHLPIQIVGELYRKNKETIERI